MNLLRTQLQCFCCWKHCLKFQRPRKKYNTTGLAHHTMVFWGAIGPTLGDCFARYISSCNPWLWSRTVERIPDPNNVIGSLPVLATLYPRRTSKFMTIAHAHLGRSGKERLLQVTKHPGSEDGLRACAFTSSMPLRFVQREFHWYSLACSCPLLKDRLRRWRCSGEVAAIIQ